MLSDLIARVRQWPHAGFRSQLKEASALVAAALVNAGAVKGELEVALDHINDLRGAAESGKDAIIAKYDGVIKSVDDKAQVTAQGQRSLTDGSGYGLSLAESGTAGWMRKLDHKSLRAGASGLDLPPASALKARDDVCDDAQRRIAGAIKQVNKATSKFEAHQKAITRRLETTGTVVAGTLTIPDEAHESVREIFQIVVVALAIALVFRSFLFQPFHIPSGSMKSTLLKGDYLFVSKYAYGFSNKSFPFGVNLFEGRIFQREPERGDVIVFKMTSDGTTDYIKRLVGLPGDKLQMRNGVLFINDTAVPRVDDGMYAYTDDRTGQSFDVQRHLETLPNGVTHATLDMTAFGRNDNTNLYRVPEGHYFFMGDNRDNSQDSRVIGGGVGFVPAENLVGRAEVIFLSVNGTAKIWQIWRWPGAIRYSRTFKKIK